MYLPRYSLSYYLLQNKDITPKEVALQREKPFPFTIMEGTLDASEELHLAAEMEVLCTFKGNLIEAILGLSYSLLLCYHVQLSPFHKFVLFCFFSFFFCTFRRAF